MRLVGLALSAALLSGCSFVGGVGKSVGGWFDGPSKSAHHGAYHRKAGYTDPCQIPHAQAPVPRGCHPSQVSIGVPNPSYAGGFPQQPQFGNPGYGQGQYASGNYGSHSSGNVHTAHHQGASQPKIRRPRFRGALDLGLEKSISGDILNSAEFVTDPFAAYDPNNFQEGRTEGSPTEGQVDRYRYYAGSRLQNQADPWDDERVPDISYQDAWSTPTTIGLSGEFIVNDRATLYARAGYTRAEGTNGGAATIEGTVFEELTSDFYDADPNTGLPRFVGSQTSTQFRTELPITEVSYDFSDMERYDLEAGGRYYFNPVAGQSTGQTITPFVGAAAGASHYNAVSYKLDQRQLSYQSVYTAETPQYYDLDNAVFDLDNDPATAPVTSVDLYDSQWVPTGRLSAGVEWQVTPSTALAFETGVRVHGARDYANGTKGDTNVTIPVTLRGSFNF